MEALSGWQSGYIEVNGLQIHYERSGGALPQLIFVHGMTDYGRYWSRVARAFADHYDVILYDMRGHGKSEAPEQGYTPDDYANDLLGVVATLGLTKPVVIGHSLGAATTTAAAAKDPSAFSMVVLEDPPWHMPTESSDTGPGLIYADAWRVNTEALQKLDHAGRVAECQREHPTWEAEDCDYWAISKELVRLQIFSGFLPMMIQPWQALVAQIPNPTLLITGDVALGGIISPEVAERFQQQAPNGQVVHIAGAGHAIHRERLTEFVAAISSFIAV